MSTESVGSWSPSLRPRRLFWEGDSRSQDAPEEQKPLYFVGEHEGHRSLDSPLKAKTSPGPSDPAADGRDYPVKQCPCGGGQCVVLVSRTERNPGRHFYRCPVKSVNEGCKYFQWCDMASPNQQHGMNSPVKPNKENGVHSPANQRFDVRSPMKLNQQHGPLKAAHPICSCGAGRCSVLTTQHGENAGRKYYACTIKKGQGACNHFQWVDSLGEQSEIRNNNLAEHKLSSPTLIPEELDIPNIDEVVNNYFDKKTSLQKQKTVKIDNHKLSSPTLIPEELDIPNIDEVVDNYFDKKTSSQKQETVKIDNHKEAKAVKVAMGYQFSSDLSTFPKSPLVSPKRQYQPNIVVATSPIKRLNLNYVSPGTSSPGKCYRCGKEGHWMSKCTGSPSSPCFKCGKVGHWKKDCTG